ncbi:class I SAM-dependent methyltransferase, partial [Nocardioides sp.]|uniref:class I SAM-dependent methyltransferase n=1 Tax=Nocardioides sp. TaxID=35761 RepID=UPI002B26D5A0
MTSSPVDPTTAMRCRHCGSAEGAVVLDLGHQPSAETFPSADTGPEHDPQHPLRMWLCASCRLAQLMEDPGTVEEQTVVVESQAMLAQGEATLDFAVEQGLLRSGDRVVEFGSPHGHPLDGLLSARGAVPVATDGAEPAHVVLDIYGLLHEPDQEAALSERLAQVAPGGSLVLQLHTLASVVATGQFSELRHGHFAYWSLPALDDALRARGWGVHRARRFDFDAGTLAVVATADPRPDVEVARLLAAEEASGATEAAGLFTLQRGADTASTALRTWLEDERSAGRRVVGYGAAGRSVP